MSGIVQPLVAGQGVALSTSYSGSTTNTSTFSTVFVIAGPSSVDPGDRILVVSAVDNSGTNGASAFSSQDFSGSTATMVLEGSRYSALNDPGAANAGVDLLCALYKCTASGTASFISSSYSVAPAAKAAAVFLLRGIPAVATAAITGFVSTNGVAATSATSPTLSTAPGDLVVGVGAVEARTGITSDASAEWLNTTDIIVADTGTAGTSMVLVAQYYKETAASTRDYTVTANAARDMIAAIFSIRAT